VADDDGSRCDYTSRDAVNVISERGADPDRVERALEAFRQAQAAWVAAGNGTSDTDGS